ncbi:hypothetical protein GCM10009765_18080 [Fodinicola feengrottensis]|uniref:Uncharacterized protein n=1 Tax=Fodinicola feengrottensis TaxID=435914 RepID=A0ABN2GDK7_9ACTN
MNDDELSKGDLDFDLCVLGDALTSWHQAVDAGEQTPIGRIAVCSEVGEPLVSVALTDWHVDRLSGYLVGEWAGLRLATPVVLVELLEKIVEPAGDSEEIIGFLAIDDSYTTCRHLLALCPRGADILAEMLGVSAAIATIERKETRSAHGRVVFRPGSRVRVLTGLQGSGLGTVSRVRTTLKVGTPELFVYDVRLDDGHGELLRFTADRLENHVRR